MRKNIKFPFEDFETSITLLLLSSSKLKKLNISTMYDAIIVIFSVNLPMVFIYKFCNPFNPTTRRTSRTSSRRSLRNTKFHQRQNNGRYTLLHICAKKLKIKSQDRKNIVLVNYSENVQNCAFLGPVTSI